jgi:hypothetical protein
MVNDSYEAGAQNWTPDLPAEFASRRGYSLISWLPALTGRIVSSAEDTDRFLWDFRRTLGELLAENHYDELSAVLHARGMIHYCEAHEMGRAFIGDGMDAKRSADIPMGAMWAPANPPLPTQQQGDADLRESASVAHLYGQNLVAAESMTALGIPGVAYSFSPQNLKPTADRELADGVNLFVIHTSVHQPLDEPGPGVTLGPYGQWFTRHETWAEQARPWIMYLSRSSYLLQQGHFVADILYYYGQDSNITALYREGLPSIPQGYAFDFVNADALTKLSVQDGVLVTASGMHYRVMALDPRASLMSIDVLERIAQLVNDGATIVGDKPKGTPSLADNRTEFDALAEAVWGQSSAGVQGSVHRYGKGRVISASSLPNAISRLRIQRDFSYSKSTSDATIWFVHRYLPDSDSDVYFLTNRNDRAERIDGRFRVIGKKPELWHADSGVREAVSYRLDNDGSTVSLDLDPYEAVFVIFHKPTERREAEVITTVRQDLMTITGPWEVQFQSGRGAPDYATLPELASWTRNLDPSVRYFSGTAIYRRATDVPKSWLGSGDHVEIDLGLVKDLAEVIVNGRSVGVLWKAPFRTDISDLLTEGKNHLEIRITNAWVNRLIGDKQPNVVPVASTTFNPYQANSPLLQSGLLGPVRIIRATHSSVRPTKYHRPH